MLKFIALATLTVATSFATVPASAFSPSECAKAKLEVHLGIGASSVPSQDYNTHVAQDCMAAGY